MVAVIVADTSASIVFSDGICQLHLSNRFQMIEEMMYFICYHQLTTIDIYKYPFLGCSGLLHKGDIASPCPISRDDELSAGKFSLLPK